MSTPKHTPGPWKIEADEENKGKHPYHDFRFIKAPDPDIDGEEIIICKMRDLSNLEANAHLIASAPDLLDHLTALASLLEDGRMPTDEEMTEIKAVIAKAKGKA